MARAPAPRTTSPMTSTCVACGARNRSVTVRSGWTSGERSAVTGVAPAPRPAVPRPRPPGGGSDCVWGWSGACAAASETAVDNVTIANILNMALLRSDVADDRLGRKDYVRAHDAGSGLGRTARRDAESCESELVPK